MKNLLFIIGPDGVGKYEACRKLIDEYKIRDLLVLDVNMYLHRKHYKCQSGQDFNTWLNQLSETEISQMLLSELKARLEVVENYINNVIITGNLSYNQVKEISFRTNNFKHKFLFVDCTKELLYRNLSLKSMYEINLENFLSNLDGLYRTKFNPLIGLAKKHNLYYCKKNALDKVEQLIADVLGYNIDKGKEIIEDYNWPIEPRYIVTAHDKYGLRPIHMILGKAKFHSGFDIVSRTLTPVKASIGGVVTYSGLDERILSGQSKWNERYGNMVETVDNYGRKELYAHLRQPLVKEGAFVKESDVIGLSGCSGGARVPHLHFEVRKYNIDHSGENNTIDPLHLLPKRDLDKLTEHFDEDIYKEVWEKMLKNPYGITDKEIPYADSKDLIR